MSLCLIHPPPPKALTPQPPPPPLFVDVAHNTYWQLVYLQGVISLAAVLDVMTEADRSLRRSLNQMSVI